MNREARKEYEAQLARRRKTWKTIRNFAIILVPVIIIGVVLSLSNSGDDSSDAVVGPKSCKDVDAPEPRDVALEAPPSNTIDPNQQYVATLETTCGTIEFDLASQQYPNSANNFKYLVDQGFYNDLAFVRAAKGFVVQAGSPTQDSAGGPGYTIQGEVPTAQPPYPAGTVAWAKTGADAPGAIGSQFFIVTGDASALPAEYAVLGTVTKGLDVAKNIEKLAPNSGDGALKRPVVITEATLRTLGVVPPST
jgi:cyclophilin family peptidyl-prolyl cis-trans isomerase